MAQADSQSGAPGFESQSGHSDAGFVLGCPEFKFLVMLVNNQMVASCQLGFLIQAVIRSIWIIGF